MPAVPPDKHLHRVERQRRVRLLVLELGSYSAAARELGVSRQAVHCLVGTGLADGRRVEATCVDCGRAVVTNSVTRQPRCSRCGASMKRTGRRGTAEQIRRPRRSHCKHGHRLDDANVYTTPDGRRQCRTCITIRLARHQAKRRTEGV